MHVFYFRSSTRYDGVLDDLHKKQNDGREKIVKLQQALQAQVCLLICLTSLRHVFEKMLHVWYCDLCFVLLLFAFNPLLSPPPPPLLNM